MSTRQSGASSKQPALLVPDDVAADLPRLQASYLKKMGNPFSHYFCPFLHKDESAEMCMGHVVPQSYTNCCRTAVPQRKDVDGFYGRVAEGHFGTLLEANRQDFIGLLLDKKLQKEMKPRFEIDGRGIEYYPYRGGVVPSNHTHIIFKDEDDGRTVEVVFKMRPEDVDAAISKKWDTIVERDARLTAMVTLIKAAYLTLFNMHGYQWAMSAGGVDIGYFLLGQFFRNNQVKPVVEVREAMRVAFAPYKHMVRPVGEYQGSIPPRGTLEDNRVGICTMTNGRPFAVQVFVRINDSLHAVLMPVGEDGDSAAAYHEFLNNDQEKLPFSHALYDPVTESWTATKDILVAEWTKRGDTFDF